MKKLKEAYESAPAWAFEPCGPCILRFSLDWVRDRVRYGHVSLDCFPSLRTINMYPMIFGKIEERHHVSQTTTLGAPPPLILGFCPSKRHASCDQGSVVLDFTLVLLVLKHFLMTSSASYPDFRSMNFSRSIMLWLFIIYEYHVVSAQSRFNLMLILVA